ncbi:response regulator [Maribacter sp. PR1]|uniref:histidine kinase n=1 Tax=Maribacter cobaltidurans TaxID=1178778 RepID=A0ABU7IRT9_9FLAO|nr:MULTISPECIES: response regulator [Maribacter]MDC6387989.1 response regulator [Maribacter sp. PR1]MEE1975378.1 response regulator [Maribacter cobaltidurans]
MSEFSKRRVNIVYKLSLLTMIISVLWFFLARSSELFELSNYIGVTVPFFVLSAVISKRGNLTLARFIYLIVFNLSVAVTSSFIGKAGSVEFILMFAMGLPFLFFSFRRERLYILIFPSLSMALWSLLYATDFNLFTTTKLDELMAGRYVYPISILTTSIFTTYQLVFFSVINLQFFSRIHSEREKAIEASNAKSKFLTMMSHEIRTPLNAITGLSHILGDTNPREDQRENIEALNYSGKILLNLLNNVLDFSKMESSGIQLNPIPADIKAAARQMKQIHGPACLKKGISLELEIDEELPSVWLDIDRFNQAINNLVSNAIKFTEKGSVTLKIKKQEEKTGSIHVRIEVIDTGFGIAQEQLETIWEPFTQASTSTDRFYGGTGLGLPIVKSVLEAMDSTVKIESDVGIGSRFYFDLELKLASDGRLDYDTEKKERNLKGRRILLVEDNKINIMVCKQVLEKANLVVDVAFDGLMAVNMVRKNIYDVVLMDIQMPVMDGYTSAMEIRKFNTTVPILALSASVFLEVKDKILQSGMNGFVFKPFNPEELFNRIEEVMDMPMAS